MTEQLAPSAEPAASRSDGAPAADPWHPLRGHTAARIGLRRNGNAVSTAEVLRFQADHAAARDAVHAPMDLPAMRAGLVSLRFRSPVAVASQASSRVEYLRRPDLGRLAADLSGLPRCSDDIGIVIADGLSATAVNRHAVHLVEAVTAALRPAYTIADPVIATQARVALGDHIGAALGVQILLMIIGERPGLSVEDSLGIYLTYHPRPDRRDSERNCISNIHPPGGLGYGQAARIVRSLVDGARALGASGVALKDSSGATLTAGTAQRRDDTDTDSDGGRPMA